MKGSRRIDDFSTAITLIAIGYLVIAGFLQSFTVANLAQVEAVSVGVYWDSDCASEVSSIDWGSLYPGASTMVRIYVRNEGDVAVRLSLTTTDWEPSGASEVISLGWDYTGQTINPNGVVQVALKLSLSLDLKGITFFSFDIVMSSEEAPTPPPRPRPPPRPVDVTPPTISILSPEPGSIINGSSLLVRWVGKDSGSGIDYYSVYLNGELEVKTKNTSCEAVGFTEGSNDIRIVGRDKVGNAGEDNVTVVLDNTPPSVSISSQRGKKVRGTGTVDFSALDDNLANVFLQIDDHLFDVTGMKYYEWNTSSVDDGTHTVKVIAIDEAGNANSSSIAVWTDNTEPVLTLSSPPDGAVVASSLNVEFSVSDISPVNVNYALDDDTLIDITGRNSFEIDTAVLSDGIHIMKFVLTDALGNSIKNAIEIIVDNTSPYVEFDVPADGSYLGDTTSVILSSDDANFDSMELYISGELAERWDTSRLNEFDWDTRRSKDGTCILKAIAYDKAGNSMEESLIVKVDNTAPNVSVISPPQGIGVAGICNIGFSALDMNLAKVFLHIDGDVSDVTGMNSYAWNTIGINDGKHMIRIRAVDKAGNVAEMQIGVKTTNQYLIIESMIGITLIALIISIWPSILASKHPII